VKSLSLPPRLPPWFWGSRADEKAKAPFLKGGLPFDAGTSRRENRAMGTNLVWLFPALTAVSVGCVFSHTAGTGPDVSYSGFDDAKVVSINPHGLSDYSSMGLGAQWTSARPADAIVTICVYTTAGISSAEVKVDGMVHGLDATRSLTQFSRMGTTAMTESCQDFVGTIDLLREIVASKKAWVRVRTTGGHMEGFVVNGQEDSKAFYALKRFLAAVGDMPKTRSRVKRAVQRHDPAEAAAAGMESPDPENSENVNRSNAPKADDPFQ